MLKQLFILFFALAAAHSLHLPTTETLYEGPGQQERLQQQQKQVPEQEQTPLQSLPGQEQIEQPNIQENILERHQQQQPSPDYESPNYTPTVTTTRTLQVLHERLPIEGEQQTQQQHLPESQQDVGEQVPRTDETVTKGEPVTDETDSSSEEESDEEETRKEGPIRAFVHPVINLAWYWKRLVTDKYRESGKQLPVQQQQPVQTECEERHQALQGEEVENEEVDEIEEALENMLNIQQIELNLLGDTRMPSTYDILILLPFKYEHQPQEQEKEQVPYGAEEVRHTQQDEYRREEAEQPLGSNKETNIESQPPTITA